MVSMSSAVECNDAKAGRLPDFLRERTASIRPVLVRMVWGTRRRADVVPILTPRVSLPIRLALEHRLSYNQPSGEREYAPGATFVSRPALAGTCVDGGPSSSSQSGCSFTPASCTDTSCRCSRLPGCRDWNASQFSHRSALARAPAV